MNMNARTTSHAGERLSEAEWRRQCPSFSVLTLIDKAVILRQGDECDHVFYIAKGRVKLLRMNQRGDQFTLAVLTEGQLFGATMSDQSREAFPDTAEAKGRTIIYRVQLTEFKRFLASRPALAWEVLGIFSKGQRVLERKLELLMFHDVRSRLVETLRDLAGSHGGNCAHGFELDIKLTQQELADLVGATRPVVSTILNEFKARGILDYHRTLICIQDLKALQ